MTGSIDACIYIVLNSPCYYTFLIYVLYFVIFRHLINDIYLETDVVSFIPPILETMGSIALVSLTG